MKRTVLMSLVSIGLIVGSLLPGVSYAWNSHARFCYPDVINTPDTWLNPPTIDGVVAGDNGWTSAWRYVFNNGTLVHDAVVQGIRDANFVYMSFEVNNDSEFSPDDALVLAFDPDNNAANRRLLHIFPVQPAGAANPVPMLYWQGFPWTGGGVAPPAGTVAAVTVSGPVGNRSWFVEVKIPRAAFGIPAAADFGMYFNVYPVQGDLAVDHPWPAESPQMLGDLKATPANMNTWGQASVAASNCNGVSITSTDIRTDNTPQSKINLNAPNTFRVTVHNNSLDGQGHAVPANNIKATFKIANFGLPSIWATVPATAPATNPTGTANIPANGTAELTTNWTLSAAERATYSAPGKQHQCILVELDTPPGGGAPTVFANKSAWTNMDFGTASEVESSPQLDPRGWKRPPAGQREQTLELSVLRQVDQLRREEVLGWSEIAEKARSGRALQRKSAGNPFEGRWEGLKSLRELPFEHNDNYKAFRERLKDAKTNVTQLTYLVHACRRTGGHIQIHNRSYEVCERVGSYGYVLRHAGRGVPRWDDALEAQGLKPMKTPGRYQMKVPVEVKGPINIHHRMRARDLEELSPRERDDMRVGPRLEPGADRIPPATGRQMTR